MNENATFYIVRHGETDWNSQKLIQGHTDIPLNTSGEEQAKSLAEEFKDVKFDLAFSSDLMRAKRTAEIIALEHDLTVEATERLRERNFGQLEGQSHTAFRTYDALYEALSNEEKKHFKYEGDVESDEEVTTRLVTFIRETAITHPGKRVLAVTHGGIVRTLLLHFGYGNYNQHIKVRNTAYIVLETDGSDFVVKETKGVEFTEK